MVFVLLFVAPNRLYCRQCLRVALRQHRDLVIQMLVDRVLDRGRTDPDRPLSQECRERTEQTATDHPQGQCMAWTNAAQLQQGIERMEVTQLVLEHSLQRAHASRMKNPRDSD